MVRIVPDAALRRVFVHNANARSPPRRDADGCANAVAHRHATANGCTNARHIDADGGNGHPTAYYAAGFEAAMGDVGGGAYGAGPGTGGYYRV